MGMPEKKDESYKFLMAYIDDDSEPQRKISIKERLTGIFQEIKSDIVLGLAYALIVGGSTLFGISLSYIFLRLVFEIP